MFMFTLILLIIFAVVIFDKLRSMKREIDAQKILIFSLRDQVSKLSQSIKEPVQSLAEVDEEAHVEIVEATQEEHIIHEIEEEATVREQEDEMEIPNVEIVPEKFVAFSMEEEAVSVEVLSPISAMAEERAVVANELESEPIFESQAEVLLEQKPLIDFDVPKEQEEKKPLFAFNSENWMGVNLLNRLGALLIVIGAIATAAFDGFPSWVRSLILFTFAASVIVLGEVMNRKKPTTASIGVTAVGVALVYIAVAASYFVLGTLGMYAALIACVMATLLGIYLAIRYDEQVVACFALVGGYLPIFALDPFNDALTIGLVVYFVLLSTYSLALALSKKWAISNFIGLFLTIAGTSYLGFQAAPLIALLYACFAFMVYTILPLLSAYKGDKTFSEMDTWLVIINAFVSSIVVFLIATRLNMPHIHAYLSAIFALIYIGLAHLIKRMFQHKSMALLFLLKAVAFAVLFVPFTFDYHWFAIAWLVEAVVLLSYGILRKQKFAEYSGFAILGIAILSFLASSMASLGSQFTLDYTFFSIGLLVILGMYMKEKRQWKGYEQVYKWVALANFWIYSMYMLTNYVHQERNGYTLAMMIVMTLGIAWSYVKIKWIADEGTHVIANVIHGVGIILLWYSNFTFGDVLRFWEVSSGILLLNLAITCLSVVMVIYYKQKEENRLWIVIYKNMMLVNLWLSLMWVISSLIALPTVIDPHHYLLTVCALITLILTVVYLKVKMLVDNGVRVIVNVMHGISVVMLWISNFFLADWNWRNESQFWLFIVNLIIAFILAGLVVYYQKRERDHAWIVAYKNINLVSLWLMIVFASTESLLTSGVLADAYIPMVIVILTLVISGIYVKVKVITDRPLHIIVNVMHGFSMLVLWFSNFEFAWWRVFNQGGLVFNLILTVVAVGMVIYYRMTEEKHKGIVIYQNVMLVNLWLSMLYIANALMRTFEGSQLILIIMTFLMALVMTRIPLLLDGGVKVIVIVMQVIGLLWLATFNLSLYESLFALLSLNAVAQLMALVTLNELVKHLRNKEGEETPFKVLILSGYFLLVVTQGIMVQGRVAFNSALISVLFGVTALAWIVLGFYLKNIHVRKFGLYLAMLSAVKLLVVDTWGLSTPMRIGSYLTLGVVLMIISFVYQKFNVVEDESE